MNIMRKKVTKTNYFDHPKTVPEDEFLIWFIRFAEGDS